MEPAMIVAGCWLLFAGTHLGLAAVPVRSALVRRLGEVGFAATFSLVAAGSFALLVRTYAGLRMDGAPGVGLASIESARLGLTCLVVLAFLLMLGSAARYAASPYALLAGPHDGGARGIERVSRHAFFAGVALFAGAHTLLATKLAGTVFFGGFALLAGFGAWHQDRKLLALRGERYARFVAATSAVPFAAIVAGRQRLAASELPWRHFVAALLFAFWLRSVHASILSDGGAWFIGFVLGSAALLTIDGLWRARRAAGLRVALDGSRP